MPGLPTKQDLLDWIRDNPDRSGKRDIARAFGLDAVEKVKLKHLLRRLRDEGELERQGRSMRPAGTLPPVTMLRIGAIDPDDVHLPGAFVQRVVEVTEHEDARRVLVEAGLGQELS